MIIPELTAFLQTFEVSLPTEHIIKLHKAIYLLNSSAQQQIDKLQEEPISAGLLLGTLKPRFSPSIALLQLITPRTKKKIILNEKASWLFVCGRDILEENILSGDAKAREVIVEDEHGQTLGLAKKTSRFYKNIKNSGELLKNK